MQAIILAAGMGRRLGEYTKENTKCMVKVNGVRLIDRLLTQLSALDLKRVLIVTGYQGEKLRNHVGNRYAGKLTIEYADNPIYDKTNNIYSLSLVKEQLQEDDTLLIESDLIFSDRLFLMILNDPNPNVALVAKYESWMDGTMVRIDAENNIINFVPKKAFNYDDVDRYYKTVNIYKFSREFSRHIYVPFLNAYCAALGNNEYYEQVLRVITLLDNSNMKALPIGNEKWYEIDDVQDLDIAETIFSENEEMLHRFNYRYGGHWRFPKMLDYCYLVNPYFPTPQMKAELKANFDTLLTEYPSGMFVNSLIAGKYFGISQPYVVVGNGAAELIKSLMEHVTGKKDWHKGIVYKRNALFYEEWTDEASQLYIDMDKELQALLHVLPVTPDCIPTILQYYESSDAELLTRKLRSIKAFQNIKVPVRQVNGGWEPDFESRYFTEDFPYGLHLIQKLAHENGIPTPNMDTVYEWDHSNLQAHHHE